MADESQSEEVMFMASDQKEKYEETKWLIDNGCTNHMTKEEKFFFQLDRSINSTIRLGNGDTVRAHGRGIVVVHTSSGIKLIHNVMYVPELHQNLLSVAQMISNGYTVTF